MEVRAPATKRVMVRVDEARARNEYQRGLIRELSGLQGERRTRAERTRARDIARKLMRYGLVTTELAADTSGQPSESRGAVGTGENDVPAGGAEAGA